MKSNGSATLLMVADGLGHGVLAAQASHEASLSFGKSTGANPAEILQRRSPRLARHSWRSRLHRRSEFRERGRVIFAGLGNVAGVLVRTSDQVAPRLQMMVTQNGTAGHEARQFKEFEYQLASDDILVMHSDGLSSHWNLQESPGLWREAAFGDRRRALSGLRPRSRRRLRPGGKKTVTPGKKELSEFTPILSVRIAAEQDIVIARQRARDLAKLFGLSPLDQIELATVTVKCSGGLPERVLSICAAG